ncbi:MAG TPA: xanthine dehydrogenase family protein molybdopterin-binding subunit [Gemmatimonadaceae bacterium]|nr:xanthine dehydrogenase family protein molybdopterin-binding subunit [Gemmatimonadaceae bacterium]
MTERSQSQGKVPGHEPAKAAPATSRFSVTTVEVEGREETKVVEIPSLEPEPWTDDSRLEVVGSAIGRVDSAEKVTGRARYTTDERPRAMLHAVIVRSPIARGRVVRLDLARALASPGVHGAITRDDVPDVKLDGVQLFDAGAISYVNQPLAAICAASVADARRALALVELEVEEEPHVLTAAQALAAGAPLVRPRGNTPRNMPRVKSRGDVEKGLQQADVTITREYRTPTALHTALEPHGAVCDWSAGHLTIWESTQGIFNTRTDVAEGLGLPLSRVRVMKNYMGGGFGAKNGAPASTFIAAILSRKLNRPVACILDREGEQTDSGNRPSTVQRVTLGARRDGMLTAITLDATITLGVGGWLGGPAGMFQGMYRCENVRTEETFVYVNAGAMNSFRAPGYTEGAFALECAMDALARELGMDRLELRRRNHAGDDQDKRRPYSAKRLVDCYDAGAKAFGWGKALDQPVAPSKRRGVGMASVTWGAGGGPPAYATVRLNRDGSIDVLTGSQDLGTGSRTILAQIAAEQLGARIEDVRTVLGDTERLPYAPNSWGSITTASVGPAIRVAAEEARLALFDAAAGMLRVEPSRLESSAGVIRVRDGDRSMTFAEVCDKLGDVMIIGQGSRGPNPDKTAISAFAAQFAEVEVDLETGQVRVLRVVSAHDSGRIINPTLARSQVEGGVIQGIGYALFEERVLDQRSGMPLNPTMHDYKIPTMADIPSIETIFVGAADTVANHTGAKGLAEPPIIGIAPAIANAVADALGRDVTEIPLTPWRILSSGRSA